MSDKKRILNLIKIDQPTFSRLKNIANIKGVAVGDFAAYVLEVAMSKWEEPDEENVAEYVSWLSLSAQVESKMHSQIIQVAAQYADNGSQKMADLLDKMCATAGLSTTKILERVQDDPLQLALSEGSAKTDKGRAMQWLPRFLLEQNGRADYPVIMEAASKMGWEAKQIKAAKEALNAGATNQIIKNNRRVRITSIKEGIVWTWVYEVEELGEETDV